MVSWFVPHLTTSPIHTPLFLSPPLDVAFPPVVVFPLHGSSPAMSNTPPTVLSARSPSPSVDPTVTVLLPRTDASPGVDVEEPRGRTADELQWHGP